MPTVVGVGLNDAADGYGCGEAVAQAALERLGEYSPTLALLFTSHSEPEKVLRGVNETLGHIPLIGVTSAGEYSHAGYVEHGAGLMLLYSDNILFELLAKNPDEPHAQTLLGNGLRGLSASGLGSEFHHRTLMLFPDDQSMNMNTMVDQAMTETGMLYDILGGPGPSHNDPPPRPSAVFYNEQIIHTGLSGTEILSQHPLGLALSNGWQPISGPYRVTRADDRRIISIDGRPAWEVFREFLKQQGLTADRNDVSEFILQFPIGICDSDDCKVCLIKAIEEDDALLVTAPPPTGSLIHILTTQPAAMISAARHAVQQAEQHLQDRPPAGMLFIDCMSTSMKLGDAYRQQRQAVQAQIGDVPFLGFRSYGVLARLPGQIMGHYACSVASCIFPQ